MQLWRHIAGIGRNGIAWEVSVRPHPDPLSCLSGFLQWNDSHPSSHNRLYYRYDYTALAEEVESSVTHLFFSSSNFSSVFSIRTHIFRSDLEGSFGQAYHNACPNARITACRFYTFIPRALIAYPPTRPTSILSSPRRRSIGLAQVRIAGQALLWICLVLTYYSIRT